jgi:hypothetical protein
MLSVNHSPHIRVFAKIETFLQACVGVEKAQIMVVTRRWQGRPCDPISSSMYMMMMVLFHINLLYYHGATDRPQVLVSSFMSKKLSKDRQFHSTYTIHYTQDSVLCSLQWITSTRVTEPNSSSLLISKAQLRQDCTHMWWVQRGPAPTYLPPTYLPTYLPLHNAHIIQDEWYVMDRKHYFLLYSCPVANLGG